MKYKILFLVCHVIIFSVLLIAINYAISQSLPQEETNSDSSERIKDDAKNAAIESAIEKRQDEQIMALMADQKREEQKIQEREEQKRNPMKLLEEFRSIGGESININRIKSLDYIRNELNAADGRYELSGELSVKINRGSAGGNAVESRELTFGRFHAVVIGNKNYKYLPILKTPLVDADEVAKVLQNQYGFTIDPLQDTTRGEIMNVLYKLRISMTERDSLLIYYAGHGEFDDANGMGYWQPIDAEQKNPDKWISIDDINSQIKAIRARHVLIVADSCHAGLLTRNSGTQLLKGELQDDYLWRMQARPSRHALTSGGNEFVVDGGGNGHSVFAEVFLTVLRNNKEFLTGTQLFDKINNPVTKHAKQTPYYGEIKSAYPLTDDTQDKGDFVFVPKRLQGNTAAENEQQQPVDLSFLERSGRDRNLQSIQKTSQNSVQLKGKIIGQYIDHGDGTITDMKSGLMWKRCSEGLSGMNCENGKTKYYTWLEAKRGLYNVVYAGHFDWRVPTIDELKTLVQCSNGVKEKNSGICNDGSEKPTINHQLFPNTEAIPFWSTSLYAVDGDDLVSKAWNVNFYYGFSFIDNREAFSALRLVRGGQ